MANKDELRAIYQVLKRLTNLVAEIVKDLDDDQPLNQRPKKSCGRKENSHPSVWVMMPHMTIFMLIDWSHPLDQFENLNRRNAHPLGNPTLSASTTKERVTVLSSVGRLSIFFKISSIPTNFMFISAAKKTKWWQDETRHPDRQDFMIFLFF